MVIRVAPTLATMLLAVVMASACAGNDRVAPSTSPSPTATPPPCSDLPAAAGQDHVDCVFHPWSAGKPFVLPRGLNAKQMFWDFSPGQVVIVSNGTDGAADRSWVVLAVHGDGRLTVHDSGIAPADEALFAPSSPRPGSGRRADGGRLWLPLDTMGR